MPILAEQLTWWVKQAEHDLEAARSQRANGFHDFCALACQQAAEKFLKALYMNVHQATPPKIHHCAQLAKLVAAPAEIVVAGHTVESKYMTSRYPDAAQGVPFEQFDDADSENLTAAAEKIRQWVLQQLTATP